MTTSQKDYYKLSWRNDTPEQRATTQKAGGFLYCLPSRLSLASGGPSSSHQIRTFGILSQISDNAR